MIERVFGVTLAVGLACTIGCGGDDPGTHFCVGDKTDSQDCTVTWELVDACSTIATFASVELAVFEQACPDDATLRSGDTSSATVRASFPPGSSFAGIDGLGTTAYGFAFVARDQTCAVRAFGCTPANLAVNTTIRTAVCDWTAKDVNGVPSCACTSLTGGGCPTTESCSAGNCQG
jgi:hypothetical protein